MSDHISPPSAERRMTLFGRNTALEILGDPSIVIYRVHLAHSNRPGPAINEILSMCEQRSIPIKMHDKQALSRISKNGRQDQGIALDVATPHHQQLDAFLADTEHNLAETDCELLLLDGITNPQNLGMIIRSLAASTMQGLVLPQKGCARLDPLVYKASAGCISKTRILSCATVEDAIGSLKSTQFKLLGLTGRGHETLSCADQFRRKVFLLGNESEGLSDAALKACDQQVMIPMQNGVESLNVAVTAGIIAFRTRG